MYRGLQSHRGNEVRQVTSGHSHRHSLLQSINGRLERWTTLISCRWKTQDEHINTLEARAVLLLPEWGCRSQLRMNKSYLHLVNNSLPLGAFIKRKRFQSHAEIQKSACSNLYPGRRPIAADGIRSFSPQSCRPFQPQASSALESRRHEEVIAPKRHVAVNRASKTERAANRASVGLLSDKLFSHSAHKRYSRACNTFFAWIRQHQQHLPADTTALDNLIVLYIDCAWEESKSKITLVICSGPYTASYQASSCLNASWRMHSAWSRHLPTRCLPVTQDMAYALSGLALHWHWIDMSVGILLGPDRLLRTGKLLQLRIADSVRNDQQTFATINWPDARENAQALRTQSA